jgi:two-component system cell cycle sensor histidine kinase/response regulator CckA
VATFNGSLRMRLMNKINFRPILNLRWPALSAAHRDLLVVICVTIAGSALALHFKVFGAIVDYVSEHEHRVAHELIVTFFVLGFASIWYAYRRGTETQREISRRLEADAKGRVLRDQLAHSQRLNAIGELAGGIAHNFNNLLTIIEGYGHRAQADLRNQARVAECLRQIHSASGRGAELTRQLLMFSRKQVLRKTVVSAADLLNGCLSLLRNALPAAYEVSLEVEMADAKIRTDPGEFVQAILNLVFNARDAMPDGGRIVVAVRAASGPDGQKGWVKFVVSDTGMGMDEATRARMFEPFFTTKGPTQGTGLGLAMVHGFVKSCGGHIDVFSSASWGTEISLLFPTTDEPLSETVVAKQASKSLLGRGETLLVVENDPLVLKVTKEQLEKCGYKVLTAVNGVEALNVERGHRGPIDVLLSDVSMPAMNGVQLAQSIRRVRPDLRIALTSGYVAKLEPPDCVPPGTIFIQKPFGPERLSQTLRTLIDGGQTAEATA